MNSPSPLRRRLFRFSLKTLFVLVTVLGVFLGWLAVQVKWIRDRHQLLASFKWSLTDSDFALPYPTVNRWPYPTETLPPWVPFPPVIPSR